ncbi:25260_t:CDS:2 [Gigaspora margarita]|uniref:25260_t:CDS:1 n=1 Tax=Gigaspora margarita TaxID=4874 RepID=A0ABM8W6G2_GIGMA|nr:25260_t:CDS:2 [Gigaspora margarita]
MVRMFLNRLKGNNTTFVAIATLKNLTEAIAAARRVEAGDYYGQRPSERGEIQQQVGTELNNIKKTIEGLALNYATLSVQLKDMKYASKSIGILISNNGMKSLALYEDDNDYSKGGDTFDEFEYEEDEFDENKS